MTTTDVQQPIQASLATSAPVLETLGVSCIYEVAGEMKTTVSNVSMRISTGEFAIIFGRSGAGKSTLLNMLLGLQPPDVGEVFIKGSTLYGYDEEQRTTIRRKRLGHVSQSVDWLDSLSLQTNVALPLLLNGQKRTKAMDNSAKLLREVGLYDRRKALPGDLSIGEQHIAAIARALIKKPWVCIADEPTAHLDTTAANEVIEILMNAKRLLGLTIVMVTHDLGLLPMADRWLFMQDGRMWNIDDRDKPFKDIQEAVSFVDSFDEVST